MIFTTPITWHGLDLALTLDGALLWPEERLLIAADLAVRLIDPHGAELKLGVLTALVGAPFFLWRVLAVRAP